MPKKSSRKRTPQTTKAVAPPAVPPPENESQQHAPPEPNPVPEDVATPQAPEPPPPVRPTAYHSQLLHDLQTHESQLWNWFAAHQTQQQAFEAARVELLKTAYRLDRESAAELYQLLDSVLHNMHLDLPVTLYQAQQASGLNASLVWLPDAAHIVLHGPVQDTLTQQELCAVLAHELAHHELLCVQDGAFLIVEQLLSAMLSDPAADVAHERTWRSYRLYTELHCDRRAAQATGDMDACVRALVKLETGLKSVSADAYLQQATEVLAGGPQTSDGVTHPEMFIRAHALQLWTTDSDTADQHLQAIIEGPLQLNTLDLIRQRRMVTLTQDLVAEFLTPAWLQTDLMLGHARRFTEDGSDFSPYLNPPPKTTPQKTTPEETGAKSELPETVSADGESDCESRVERLKRQLSDCDSELRKFACYVLLDFVTCDYELDEAPLSAAFLLTRQLDLLEEFRSLAAQELKLGKRALQKIEKAAG